MQYEYFEHQWNGSATQPEWLNDRFDVFHAWHSVNGPAGQIGMHTREGVQFADLGDWIIANTDGTYSIVKDEDHVPL